MPNQQGVKYAEFSDPDGNLWLLQEFPSAMAETPELCDDAPAR